MLIFAHFIPMKAARSSSSFFHIIPESGSEILKVNSAKAQAQVITVSKAILGQRPQDRLGTQALFSLLKLRRSASSPLEMSVLSLCEAITGNVSLPRHRNDLESI